MEPLKAFQLRDVLQPGIGDLGVVNEKLLQSLEAHEILQPGV